MRVGILKLARHVNSRQDCRAHLNIKTFRPLNLLARPQDVGVSPQRSQNRLFYCKSWNPGASPSAFAGRIATRKKRAERRERQNCKRDQSREKIFSHERLVL